MWVCAHPLAAAATDDDDSKCNSSPCDPHLPPKTKRKKKLRNPKAAGAGADGDSRAFTFDQAYGPDSTQREVFEVTARPIVDAVLEGYNGEQQRCWSVSMARARARAECGAL